ncbi:MAG: hypothetical protein KAV82_14060 [Phycisphaerae bacterium]|nr:hypothetical protein [Phycisphaerae bacterium]
MKEPVYRVHFDTGACKVRARVNDCPMFKTSGKRHLITEITVNGWLEKGENLLEISIEPPRKQEALSKEDAYLRGKVTAGDMTLDRETRPEVTLAEFELDLDTDDTGTYPIVLVEEFKVPTDFPAWLWLTARRLTIDDAFRREATELVRRLWDALGRNDLDEAVGMQTVRNQEMARAMFQRTDERVADVREGLGRLTNDSTSTLRGLNPDEFEFPLFGNGRLARVDDAKGSPVVRYEFPETRVFASIPVFLTRNRSGKLTWVR